MRNIYSLIHLSKMKSNRNVLLSIRGKTGSRNGIFMIIGKMTLRKRVRKQNENKSYRQLCVVQVLGLSSPPGARGKGLHREMPQGGMVETNVEDHITVSISL